MDEDDKKFDNPSTDNANAFGQLPAGPGVSSGQQQVARNVIHHATGSNSAAVKGLFGIAQLH